MQVDELGEELGVGAGALLADVEDAEGVDEVEVWFAS